MAASQLGGVAALKPASVADVQAPFHPAQLLLILGDWWWWWWAASVTRSPTRSAPGVLTPLAPLKHATGQGFLHSMLQHMEYLPCHPLAIGLDAESLSLFISTKCLSIGKTKVCLFHPHPPLPFHNFPSVWSPPQCQW